MTVASVQRLMWGECRMGRAEWCEWLRSTKVGWMQGTGVACKSKMGRQLTLRAIRPQKRKRHMEGRTQKAARHHARAANL